MVAGEGGRICDAGTCLGGLRSHPQIATSTIRTLRSIWYVLCNLTADRDLQGRSSTDPADEPLFFGFAWPTAVTRL